MIVHEDDVLPGFRRARVEVLIIEQQRRRLRRKTEDGVGIGVLDDVAVDDNNSPQVDILCLGLVDAVAVQFSVPLVARSFGFEKAAFIHRTFEDRRTVGA